MEHARKAGYPVPEVRDVSGPDMVVRRVEGRTMSDDGMRRPWRLSAHARTLGELHRRLHEIPPPPGLRTPFGAGDAFLHLDLHPQNVLIADDGPWVIDWANAARGPAPVDVALTFVIVGAVPKARSPLQRFAGALRARFAVEFLSAADPAGVQEALPVAIDFRLADQNVRQDEREAVEALRARILRR
ncbi:MAG TPA: phosphotransferase [Candidatus Limnocylindria bacterium]|nr:phosphotransferase [Candidatus Limnocylindria bacterium]